MEDFFLYHCLLIHFIVSNSAVVLMAIYVSSTFSLLPEMLHHSTCVLLPLSRHQQHLPFPLGPPAFSPRFVMTYRAHGKWAYPRTLFPVKKQRIVRLGDGILQRSNTVKSSSDKVLFSKSPHFRKRLTSELHDPSPGALKLTQEAVRFTLSASSARECCLGEGLSGGSGKSASFRASRAVLPGDSSLVGNVFFL